MSRDYKDGAIEQLALSEAELLDRIVDLTIERDSYRMLAVQSIHALHDLQQREREHQERYRRLLAECRSLHEQILRAEAA